MDGFGFPMGGAAEGVDDVFGGEWILFPKDFHDDPFGVGDLGCWRRFFTFGEHCSYKCRTCLSYICRTGKKNFMKAWGPGVLRDIRCVDGPEEDQRRYH